MSTTPIQPRRSILMAVLRAAPVPIVLIGLTSGALVGIGASNSEWRILWDVGYHALILNALAFVVVLWGGVYLEVLEASRGMPGMRAVEKPEMRPEEAATLREHEESLSACSADDPVGTAHPARSHMAPRGRTNRGVLANVPPPQDGARAAVRARVGDPVLAVM